MFNFIGFEPAVTRHLILAPCDDAGSITSVTAFTVILHALAIQISYGGLFECHALSQGGGGRLVKVWKVYNVRAVRSLSVLAGFPNAGGASQCWRGFPVLTGFPSADGISQCWQGFPGLAGFFLWHRFVQTALLVWLQITSSGINNGDGCNQRISCHISVPRPWMRSSRFSA